LPAGAEQARLALPAMTSERRGSVFSLSAPARERLAFVAVASALIVAGGLVAAVNGAAAFAHGSWLAAYLVLVGGVAQLHPTRLGRAARRRTPPARWSSPGVPECLALPLPRCGVKVSRRQRA
jgi:hypothetical protein